MHMRPQLRGFIFQQDDACGMHVQRNSKLFLLVRFGDCIQLWFTPSVHKCAFGSTREETGT